MFIKITRCFRCMIQNLRENRDLGQRVHFSIYGLRASVVKMPSKPNDKQLVQPGEDLMFRSPRSENRLIRILTSSYIFHDKTKRFYQLKGWRWINIIHLIRIIISLFINYAARKTLYFASCKKRDLSSWLHRGIFSTSHSSRMFLQNYVVFIFGTTFVNREEIHKHH